jgi:hypothetical protein
MNKRSFSVIGMKTSRNYRGVALIGRRVYNEMFANAGTFAEPDPSMADFKAALEELELLISKAEGGEHLAVEARNKMSESVYLMLKKLQAYVTKVADGERITILLSGFDANEEAAPHPVPEKVVVRSVDFGDVIHSARIRIETLKNVRTYKVEQSLTPSEENSWKLAVDNVSSRELNVKGLIRAQEIWFRVAAGNARGWGEWSEPVAFIAK